MPALPTSYTSYFLYFLLPTSYLRYEAMECLGGNGYVEEGPMARLYRQAPLNSIWEGSGNVICLDILRSLAKEPHAAGALLVHEAGGTVSDTVGNALDFSVGRDGTTLPTHVVGVLATNGDVHPDVLRQSGLETLQAASKA